MFNLQNALLAGLAFAISVIILQDFKYRLVSVWILLVFGALCISSVLISRDLKTLLTNSTCSILYFSLIWLILKLYLYVKYNKNKHIFDELLGWADVLVILFIGITLNLIGLIFFFCLGFIFSLIAWLAYSSVNKNAINESVPLAALLLIFYGLTIIALHLVEVNEYVDCSFVSL